MEENKPQPSQIPDPANINQDPTVNLVNIVAKGTKAKGKRSLKKNEIIALLKEKQEKNHGGRPTIYSTELADAICAELAKGISLSRVCSENDEFPCMATIFNWIGSNKEFLEKYARAKEESAEAMSDEILDICDDGRNDWMEVELKNGGSFLKVDQEAVQRSKLRVETRKWLMAKMKPKKYGDKMDVTSGGEKLAPPPNKITFVNFSKREDNDES